MHSISRRALALALATTGAFAGVGLGSTASASSCPSGYHCVYRDVLDDNQIEEFFNNDNAFSNNYFASSGGIVDEQTSAARNSSTGNYRSRYWYHDNQVSIVFCVNPGSYVGSLPTDGIADNGVSRNDEASSLDLAVGSLTGCY
jgi:hypothetical protein